MVTSVSPNGTGAVTQTATCPAGTLLVGGGGLLSDRSNDELATSYPSATGEGGSWTAGGDRRSGPSEPDSTLTAYAICAPIQA